MKFFFLHAIFGWTLTLSTAGEPLVDSSMEISKTRSYPGGIDEEVLRVQTAVNSPQRRMDAKTVQGQILKNSGRVEMMEESPSSAPPAE